MSAIPQRFTFESQPVAAPTATVREGNARFTVLTSRCIRMEYSAEGEFEDCASTVFWFRRQPVPQFTIRRNRGVLTLTTGHLTLRYHARAGVFTPDSLQVTLKGVPKRVWKFGDTDESNLGGTFRTLDGQKGFVKLDAGLMSRSGWSVVDDSKSAVFADDCWIGARGNGEQQRDLYFFGYGTDYKGCLQDFCAVSGKIPLIPRWALGNWWSRFWEYSHEELMQLMGEFRTHNVPLSVCIIDMDWHVVKNRFTSGWTGYTWDQKLFPDPRASLKQLRHEFGLKVALNLHPHDGVHPHEEFYPAFAKFMGMDPAKMQPVKFEITDPKYADGYFRYLHHPHEKMGVDFWWMDWQQGHKSGIEGLDPLVMLNHLHFLDLKRDGTKRPFIFSRWHGLGNHRYQIGFSGDTIVCWESLAALPHFTATAANVGYSWWSHDIGGHFWGYENPEHYIRWVQFGVFSPIMRLHSSKNRFQVRTPWENGTEADVVASAALRLRHQLVPYLYSMAAKTHHDALPLCRPMYWEHPHDEQAYSCPRQYYFGTELVAAPFVSARDPHTRLSRQVVWLPEGDWYQFFTGLRFRGDGWHAVYVGIEDIPVFAKAGAIVPMSADESGGGAGNPGHLRVRLFAGADGEFSLYEDDGESNTFEEGAWCTTAISQTFSARGVTLTVPAPLGDRRTLPTRRRWTFELVGVVHDCAVHVACGKKKLCAETRYDAKRSMLIIDLPPCAVTDTLVLRVSTTGRSVLDRTDRSAERLHDLLLHFDAHCNALGAAYDAVVKYGGATAKMGEVAPALHPSQMRLLCEQAFDAGMEVIHDAADNCRLVVMWNNTNRRGIRFDLLSGHQQGHTGGAVARFQRIPYTTFSWGRHDAYISDWGPWELAFNYNDTHRVIARGDGHRSVAVV